MMISLPSMVMLLVLFASTAVVVDGFQPTPVSPHAGNTANKQTNPVVLSMSADDADDATEEEGDEDELFLPLTPTQIKSLRKEISKRQARKQLATQFLSPEESDSGVFTEETLQKIVDDLEQHDLCQVRGISRSSIKHVYTTSDRLEHDLSLHANAEVERVVTKGHATVFFRHGGDNIQLRTSYQPGVWERKPKPARDNRGQIIRE